MARAVEDLKQRDLRKAREARACKKHLAELTNAVRAFLSRIDAEMQRPSTPERGQKIAALTNSLEYANDTARYFGLGVDYRKDKKK